MAVERPPDYPARLLCNGRPADPDFSPTEELYFRIPPLEVDEVSLDFVPPGTIPSLPFSVNRGKYSRPNDVIFGNPNCGIAMLRVQDVPIELISDTGTKFDFRVEHLPVDEGEINNYSHAEVKVYRDGIEFDHKDVPKKVKVAFREVVSRRTKVFKHPKMPDKVSRQ